MKTNEDAGAVAQQVIGLCDWLASLNWAQLEALGEDSRAIQSKTILDAVEQVLCLTQAMREAQTSEIERLLPNRNMLAKQYQQRSYTSAIEKLIPLAVEVRRWARRVAEYLLNEVALDVKTHCEKCPWNAELSQEIKRQLLDERSCLGKPTPPLVSTGGRATDEKKTSSGGARRKRGSGELTNSQELMAAAVRQWHQYENESLSCVNCEPITQAELARRCGIKKGKLTKQFFDTWLGRNDEYKRLCSSGSKALALAIAKLSREGALAVATLALETMQDAKAKRPDDIDD